MSDIDCHILHLNHLMGYRRYRLKWNNGWELWIHSNPFVLEFVKRLE